MNQAEATKIIADTNKRIENALNTCVTLSKDLTEERQKTAQQADQLDMLCAALMFMMKRHRFEFINIEKSDLADLAKTHFIYFEIDPASSKVFLEKREREIPYSEFKEQCATQTPGNTGEKPSDSTQPETSTTSHYEHNPNNEATALPS